MHGGWVASMQAALLSALAHPAWWALALAAFLVRGGILLVLLPIVSLPTTAGITNAVAPTVEDLILGRATISTIVSGALIVLAAISFVYLLLYLGAVLELALLRETTADEELDLGWTPRHPAASTSLAIQLLAHIPTVLAITWASIRIIEVMFVELTSPGDAATPLVLRVLGQALDAPVAIGVAWLLGDAVAGITRRRVAAGEPVGGAFARSIRQIAGPRGLATLAVTTLSLAALLVPFLFLAGRAWTDVRVALLDGAAPIVAFAALLLLVSTWILGLALLGALLAWRSAAWTVQIAPRAAPVTQPMLQASEPSR